MGVAVLHPQDCLKQPFSHMKYPRNPSACPNRQKKPVPNRTRRSPPRNQTTRSPPPVAQPLSPPRAAVSAFPQKAPVKKNPNNIIVGGQVRILKRGEEIPKKTAELVVEKPDLGKARSGIYSSVVEKPDLGSTRQIRISVRKSKAAPFYAGPVTMTSPPPSDVPLPAFFTTKNSVSMIQTTEATSDIIRMLRLDIA